MRKKKKTAKQTYRVHHISLMLFSVYGFLLDLRLKANFSIDDMNTVHLLFFVFCNCIFANIITLLAINSI